MMGEMNETKYPQCEDCAYWVDEMCHYAEPFMATRETQRSRPVKPKSLNCGIEGKNFKARLSNTYKVKKEKENE